MISAASIGWYYEKNYNWNYLRIDKYRLAQFFHFIFVGAMVGRYRL